jgi:hypothetical protein
MPATGNTATFRIPTPGVTDVVLRAQCAAYSASGLEATSHVNRLSL